MKIPLAAYIAARGDFMYDILLGAESIGKAQVEKEGLYYRISCRCRLSGEVPYKVHAACAGKCEDLGLLVPQNGAFALTTRLPIKRLGEGQLEFKAVPRHPKYEGEFIPISVEEPFSYLSRLENAYMQIRDGKIGVILP